MYTLASISFNLLNNQEKYKLFSFGAKFLIH